MTITNIGKSSILKLYRELLKSASKISNYNFKDHSKRKIKYEFMLNKNLSNQAESLEKYQYGEHQLKFLKRYATISQLYPEAHSVI